MTSETEPKTIMLRGSMSSHSERVCAENSIRPGMLVEIDSLNRFRPHATAAGQAAPTFAREASMIGRDIDDLYVQNETVHAWDCQSGDQVYAILEDGHNVAVGAILESAGDGSLQPVTGNFGIAKALEAVNTSGGAVATSRIRVQVL